MLRLFCAVGCILTDSDHETCISQNLVIKTTYRVLPTYAILMNFQSKAIIAFKLKVILSTIGYHKQNKELLGRPFVVWLFTIFCKLVVENLPQFLVMLWKESVIYLREWAFHFVDTYYWA